MILDNLNNWRSYKDLEKLRPAFELLDSPDALKWPEGRLELDGQRIIAMPQSYQTRSKDAALFEAHRKYIDIQYIVSGGETVQWSFVTKLEESKTYDADRDVAFYCGVGDSFTLAKGMFAVFFPHDAHMPCVRIGNQAQQVRKIVMKVAVEESL